jgi:hypothetical protein
MTSDLESTIFPITFKQLQMLFNSIGYGLGKRSGDILHWNQETKPEGLKKEAGEWPTVVTTKMPTLTSPGISELVYDRSYVIDLFKHITGDPQDKLGLKILAILSQEDRG